MRGITLHSLSLTIQLGNRVTTVNIQRDANTGNHSFEFRAWQVNTNAPNMLPREI